MISLSKWGDENCTQNSKSIILTELRKGVTNLGIWLSFPFLVMSSITFSFCCLHQVDIFIELPTRTVRFFLHNLIWFKYPFLLYRRSHSTCRESPTGWNQKWEVKNVVKNCQQQNPHPHIHFSNHFPLSKESKCKVD